jgi:hypothetical protein
MNLCYFVISSAFLARKEEKKEKRKKTKKRRKERIPATLVVSSRNTCKTKVRRKGNKKGRTRKKHTQPRYVQ